MQETQVQSLVQEDSTCCGATKPVHHSYWFCALEPRNHNYQAHELQLLKPSCPGARVSQEKPQKWEAWAPQLESSPHSLQLEKSPCSNEDLAQPNINKYILKIIISGIHVILFVEITAVFKNYHLIFVSKKAQEK